MRDRFFDGFRAAVARLPAGLIRVSEPAPAADLAAAVQKLGGAVPPVLVSFLSSWNGAELFNESIVVLPVTAGTGRPSLMSENTGTHERLVPPWRKDDLVFALGAQEDRFVLSGPPDHKRVFRVDPGSDERWLAGSDLVTWLDAVIAVESVLYDRDGEFIEDAFDLQTGTVVPLIALRQVERGLKKDPGAADLHHQHGLALRQLGRSRSAVAAFVQAARLDPENPWSWFEIGRTQYDDESDFEAAADAFAQAGRRVNGAEAARMFAYQARALAAAGDESARLAARQAALAADPHLVESLQRAASAAFAVQDTAAFTEADSLAAALDDRRDNARRLPILKAVSTRPPAPRNDPEELTAPRSTSGKTRPARPPAGARGKQVNAKPARPGPRKARPGPARARPPRPSKPRRG